MSTYTWSTEHSIELVNFDVKYSSLQIIILQFFFFSVGILDAFVSNNNATLLDYCHLFSNMQRACYPSKNASSLTKPLEDSSLDHLKLI